MLSSIVEHSGISLMSVSFVLAVGQFSFGVMQPLFGILADHKGSRFSLILGILCTAIGILLTPARKSIFSLMLVLGILIPGGIGAIAYGVVVSTVNPHLPEKSRSVVSGIINASSSIGNSLLTPIMHNLPAAGGLAYGMYMQSIPIFLMIPAVLRMKNVLGTLYGSRAVMTLLFPALPKSMLSICSYIFFLGFTGSATVTPVAGICGKLFGKRGVSILFGFAFFMHQIGGFLSAWLGGLCYELLGSYSVIWLVDCALRLLVAVVSYLIREKQVIAVSD